MGPLVTKVAPARLSVKCYTYMFLGVYKHRPKLFTYMICIGAVLLSRSVSSNMRTRLDGRVGEGLRFNRAVAPSLTFPTLRNTVGNNRDTMQI